MEIALIGIRAAKPDSMPTCKSRSTSHWWRACWQRYLGRDPCTGAGRPLLLVGAFIVPGISSPSDDGTFLGGLARLRIRHELAAVHTLNDWSARLTACARTAG